MITVRRAHFISPSVIIKHCTRNAVQMVWLATTDLGCAVAYCNGGTPFHVCR